MNKPIRIYGRLRKIGDDYYEAEYKDYRPDGTVFGYGFEDFPANGSKLRPRSMRCMFTTERQCTELYAKAGE